MRKQQEREQRRRYEEMEQLRREEERRHAEREQVRTSDITLSIQRGAWPPDTCLSSLRLCHFSISQTLYCGSEVSCAAQNVVVYYIFCLQRIDSSSKDC